ncbi:MAG: DUF502 domain-containing protein [Chloroflexi bacterium]|nr:DUF502 domain-containing protein [Chloroflexota bacterium]
MSIDVARNPENPFNRMRGYATRAVVSGLAIVLPFLAVYLLARFLFMTLNGILQPSVEPMVGRIPGAGVVALVALLFVVGLIFATRAGHRVLDAMQRGVSRLPLIGAPYTMARQMSEFLTDSAQNRFKRVVTIEYPRRGLLAVGLVTATVKDEKGDSLLVVYLPTSPSPNSGSLVLVPEEDVRETDITVAAALKMVVSCGMVSPESLRDARETVGPIAPIQSGVCSKNDDAWATGPFRSQMASHMTLVEDLVGTHKDGSVQS